jgi:ribonuclease HI
LVSCFFFVVLTRLLYANGYMLFFDGGSRGNPGPGGAGSRIVWSAATSLTAPTMTNNQAEYIGLITGLKAAARAAWYPLEVVGDSLLILRQVERYRPPKNPRLRDLYLQARGLADQIGVARWHHHLRAYNKMADAPANIAMDGRRSILSFHPTPHPEWAGIELLLQGDFLQWRGASSP